MAWIVQECPAFFVSATLLFEAWASTNTSSKILVGMFILHYFQRYYWYIRALQSIGLPNKSSLPVIFFVEQKEMKALNNTKLILN